MESPTIGIGNDINVWCKAQLRAIEILKHDFDKVVNEEIPKMKLFWNKIDHLERDERDISVFVNQIAFIMMKSASTKNVAEQLIQKHNQIIKQTRSINDAKIANKLKIKRIINSNHDMHDMHELKKLIEYSLLINEALTRQ